MLAEISDELKRGRNLDNPFNLHNAITLSLCNLSIICQFFNAPPPKKRKKYCSR